jgi:hypothetical protein
MREFIIFIAALMRGDHLMHTIPGPAINTSNRVRPELNGDWPEGDNIAWTDSGPMRRG